LIYIKGNGSCPLLVKAPFNAIARCVGGRSVPRDYKPTGLVADAIQDVTRRGDLVLDLFLGSGTTLMAAERTGRRFRGLDIDPAYVDVAIERWSARTGLEPRLEEPAS